MVIVEEMHDSACWVALRDRRNCCVCRRWSQMMAIAAQVECMLGVVGKGGHETSAQNRVIFSANRNNESIVRAVRERTWPVE